jgi:hypothetical protein
MSSFESLPTDILHYLTSQFIVPIFSDEDLDNIPFPVTLLSLQMVNHRFYRLISTVGENSFIRKSINNFRNRPSPKPMVSEACRAFGSISLLEWLTETLHFPIIDEYLYSAIEGGHLPLVRWLKRNVKHLRPFWTAYRCLFVRNRNLSQIREMLFWLVENNLRKEEDFWREVIESAVEKGEMALADWLVHVSSTSWAKHRRFLVAAIQSKRVSVLEAVLSRGVPMELPSDFRYVIPHTLDMVRLLNEKYSIALTIEVSEEAARNGRVDTLQYLKEKGAPLSTRLPLLAVCYCRPQVLEWSRANGMRLPLKEISLENLADCCGAVTSDTDLEKMYTVLREMDRERFQSALPAAEDIAECFPSYHKWKLLLSFGIKSSLPAIGFVANSYRYDALQTITLLVDALPELPPKEQRNVEIRHMRKDVRKYLLAKGIITTV